MGLLRIERAIGWIARALTANRDANPVPEGYLDFIFPTIEIFGSERADQMQVETVLGALGAIEISHSAVPDGFARLYQSIEYFHDDGGTNQHLMAGRIIPTDVGFPFAAMVSSILTPAIQHLAVRNFTVGPRQRAAVQTLSALGAGSRLSLQVVWIEFPVGEYVRTIV